MGDPACLWDPSPEYQVQVVVRPRPLTNWAAALGGLTGLARQGKLSARALAVLDSRSLVRTLFLASAVRFELIGLLGSDRSADELAELLGTRRPDRLRAWLQVGIDVGELRKRGDRYRVVGRRARALADHDKLLVAHYRSMLDYQVGPYAELDMLLREDLHSGRDDLERYAEDIAQVSVAATPFVSSMVRQTLAELRPARVLDVGCGSGVYARVVLDSDPSTRVDGVDLAESVIVAARRELAEAGYGSRAQLHVGDIREWLSHSEARFDLVMLLNNIYYFDRARRHEIYAQLGASLTNGGQLLLVSMTTPGSIAAAHLDFMLRCQSGTASLPSFTDLQSDLDAAGYETIEVRKLVPTEPFIGIRARLRRSRQGSFRPE
jgi:4-hydroxy-2,2'-bipyrrole-5-carbaldehyde O-methyltransferase